MMSEFNFDKLKNHEIPDSWVSGALNVPPQTEKEPIIYPNFTKTLAFVATLVVVCALSVTLFFLTQKGDILPKEPTIPTTKIFETQTDTPTYNSSDETKKVTDETTSTQTEDPQDEETQADETIKSEPTEEKTEKETSKPTQSQTQKPTQKPSSKPNGDKTPSNPDSNNPAGKPNSSKPSLNPEHPEDAPVSTEDIDGPSLEPDSYLSFSAIVDKSKLNGSNTVYFSIRSNDMEDMWTESEPQKFPAQISHTSGNNAILKFYPVPNELVPKSGNYIYCFYNSKGEVIFADVKYIVV